MAVFEDLGFYKADFSMAEVMPWGRNASCDFLTEKCMEKNITQWPEMFCNTTKMVSQCPTDRLSLGTCLIISVGRAMAPYYQYFTNASRWALTVPGLLPGYRDLQ
ncbi:putative Leishmanolysin [Leishmania naiffi]|uniref:Leishmanolysin n=1 Tax=Leishmania naiffi TaxID=5678 RepID=A0AAW3C9X9_9TRYP